MKEVSLFEIIDQQKLERALQNKNSMLDKSRNKSLCFCLICERNERSGWCNRSKAWCYRVKKDCPYNNEFMEEMKMLFKNRSAGKDYAPSFNSETNK